MRWPGLLSCHPTAIRRKRSRNAPYKRRRWLQSTPRRGSIGIGCRALCQIRRAYAPTHLGYARVSTYGQALDAQLDQLRKAGCTKIYREKVTGARADRRELLKLLKAVAPGDMVTVTRIDRLARSTFDLFAIVKQIVDAKGQFRSLAEPWADTATSTGRLMIAVLGGLADVERDLIRTRTAEGRSRAMARGQHMGRLPKLTPQQQKEARRRRAEGETLKEMAKRYNVGKSTISRHAVRRSGCFGFRHIFCVDGDDTRAAPMSGRHHSQRLVLGHAKFCLQNRDDEPARRKIIIDQDDFMQPRPFDLYLILDLGLGDGVSHGQTPLAWGTDRVRAPAS